VAWEMTEKIRKLGPNPAKKTAHSSELMAHGKKEAISHEL
jgi:hypothetical protein